MAKGAYYINPSKHKSSIEKHENFRKLNSGDYLKEKKVSFESQHCYTIENNINKVINSQGSNIPCKITNSINIQGSTTSLSKNKSSPENHSDAPKIVNNSCQQPRCPEKVLNVSVKKKILKKEYSSLFVFKPSNKIRLMAEVITNAKYLFIFNFIFEVFLR